MATTAHKLLKQKPALKIFHATMLVTRAEPPDKPLSESEWWTALSSCPPFLRTAYLITSWAGSRFERAPKRLPRSRR